MYLFKTYIIQLTRHPSGEYNYFAGMNSGAGKWADDYNMAHVFEEEEDAHKVIDDLGHYFTYGSTMKIIAIGPNTDLVNRMNELVNKITQI